MSQVILREKTKTYYVPALKNTAYEKFVKLSHKKTQEFLKELWNNNFGLNPLNYFPLEYFWWRTWIGVYRTIAYCYDLLDHFSVNEIILIDRSSYVVEGGLLINHKSYIRLIQHFFESKGIKVKCIEKTNSSPKPKTIFYNQKVDWKRGLIHFANFILWKTMSFNKKQHGYILIKPGYENVINYKRPYLYSSDKSCPQAYHGEQLPFLHSAISLFQFWAAKRKLSANAIRQNNVRNLSFMDTIWGFTFNFSEYFQETIDQYLEDTKWMDTYINSFWDTCFQKHKPGLIIFGITPVHLDAYFLIKKIKSCGGKVATRQHGGYYSYTKDFAWSTAQDYTCTDYFLSFGKSDINNLELSRGFDGNPKSVEVGSNIIAKPKPNSGKIKGLFNSQGIYIPGDISNFTAFPIDKASQLNTAKMIVGFLASLNNIKTVVKGLRGHKFHEGIKTYIERNSLINLSYTSVALNKALSKKPKFVILDYSSTPLLQVLGQYSGPIFLLLSQPPWVKKEALQLLKQRIYISKSVDELKSQLIFLLEVGELKEVNLMDNTFLDVYCKPFNYCIYENFLNEAIKT